MEFVPFDQAVEIWDTLRKPVNAKERQNRIEGKDIHELYPYYGATGQVGYIDGYISDGEYVLLGEDGAPFLQPTATKAYLIHGKAWVNNHAHVLRSKFNNAFLCHYLNSFNYQGFVSGTTRLKLTQSAMKQIPIPAPPISEQERIVSRIEELFSQLDASVVELKTAKERLRVYRQAVLKEAFEGTLTAPEKFGTALLGSYIEKPRYGTSKKCDYAHSEESVDVYRIPNIDYATGQISHEDIKYSEFSNNELAQIELESGDILIIRSNGSVSLVGRAALVREIDTKGTFAGYLMRLRIKDKSSLIPEFLLYYLQSHEARIYIENKAKSTSGVHNINSAEISSLKIPVFRADDQESIVVTIESRLSVCDSIEKTVDTALQQAEALRQSILKKAFEGGL